MPYATSVLDIEVGNRYVSKWADYLNIKLEGNSVLLQFLARTTEVNVRNLNGIKGLRLVAVICLLNSDIALISIVFGLR